jgi:acyl carrier protein
MQKEDITAKLLVIIKTYLPEDVKPEVIEMQSHLMINLGINSAHLVDIVLDVEDAFDITLDEKDMEAMQTLEAAVRIVYEKLSV